MADVFQFVMQALYDHDVLPEQAIVRWAAAADAAPAGSARKARRTQCAPFLTWLAEAESDSGDENEDD